MNEFERTLIESPDLPTLPAVAQRVLELCSRDDVDLIQLADTIGYDAAVTTRVLRLINSAVYGLAREVVSIREAVLYLGFRAVRSVALSFSFIHTLRGEGGAPEQTLDELWRTSLSNALAARRLATEVGGWDLEEAFLSGLISDCGALLLYKKVPEYAEVLQCFRNGEGDLIELERARLETDHMRVGMYLLKTWQFPPEFYKVVGAHHDSSQLKADTRLDLRVRILSGAWLCARALTVPGFASETAGLDRRVSGLLGLPEEVVRAIASELPDEIREIAAVFEIPASEQLGFDELLERANQKLSRFALDAEHALMESEEEGATYDRVRFTELRQELVSSLPVDEPSGLLSREAFETVLTAFHRRAREARSSLGLMLILINELKEVEADAEPGLVREIRNRTETQTRTSDVCGRFEDDQVAVLIAGCGRSDLEHVAERVRVALEGRPLPFGSEARSCSVTIGIAGTTPHLDGLDVRALLRLSCSALDRAHDSPERIAVEG